MISWLYQSPKTILHGRDAILRVRSKWLIFKIIPYYERTWSITSLPGLVFRRRRAVFILLAMPPTSTEVGVRGVGWLIQASAWNQTCCSTNDRCEALASAKGCFLCFCFCAPCIYPLIRNRFSVQSVESVWGFFMIYTHSRKALDISIQRLVAHRGVEPLLQEWKSWVLADIRMRHSLATQRELKSQRLSVVT